MLNGHLTINESEETALSIETSAAKATLPIGNDAASQADVTLNAIFVEPLVEKAFPD